MSIPTTSVHKVIPPFRFAIVEEGLYRGAYPTEHNRKFLRRLRLKTILSLTPKKPDKVFEDYCEREGITIHHVHVPKFKDNNDTTLSPSQIVHILQIIISPENLPLYIHCLDGANVTGIVVMCLRKLQNWNLSAIYSEFSRFTREYYISSTESEFVEMFQAEIEIPPVIPKWLWQGERVTKHPSLIKLKVLPDLEAAKAFSLPSEKEIDSTTSSLLLTSDGGSTSSTSSSSSSTQKLKDITLLKTQFESGKYHQSSDSLSRDLYALSLEVPSSKDPKTEQS